MITDTLGFPGVGLQLQLPQTAFRPGAVIRGSVRMTFAEPVNGRRLIVGIDAKQRIMGLRPLSRGVTNRRDTVWRFEVDVAGERTYKRGESFGFKLAVPDHALDSSFVAPKGPLGSAVQVLSFLSATTRFPLEWRVYACLVRSWKLNLRVYAPIQIQQQAGATKKSATKRRVRTTGVKRKRRKT